MQRQLRSVPNFIPSRQHAANPLSSSLSLGPRAALSCPPSLAFGGCPKVNVIPGSSHRRAPRDAGPGSSGRRTHPDGGRARRGSPCPRGRSWVRWPPVPGCAGRPAAGPRRGERRPISARLPPGPARGPAGLAAPGGHEPPRATRGASGRVAWTRLPWQPELEAFPARPRPARRRRPSSRRVPTPKIARPRRCRFPLSSRPGGRGVGGRGFLLLGNKSLW